MKKLMTMIAAVATAFGLFADEPAEAYSNYVDFVDAPVIEGTNHYDWQTAGGWTYAGAADTLTVADDLLTIKTGANVLSRTNSQAIDAEKGLFLDAVIDFENQYLDELPEVAADGTDGKLAIFAYDNSGDEAAVAAGKVGTNLYVIAGYGADSKALFKISSLDETSFDQAKRVTVKAYQNVTASGDACGGYMIYVDGEMKKAIRGFNFNADGKTIDWTSEFDTNFLGTGAPAVKSALSGWASQGALFLSLDKAPNTTVDLTAVDFKGNAILEYVTLTDEKMDFIASDANSMNVAAGTDVTVVSISGAGTLSDDKKTITLPNGADPAITMTVDYPDGYIFNAELSNGGEVTVDGDTVSFTFAKDATLTLTAVAPAATVTVDGETYQVTTLAEAIEAVNGAETQGKLVLEQAVVLAEGEQISFAGKDVILDLNGKTITGAGDGDNGTVIYNTGKLLITDTSDGQVGSVVSIAAEDAVAVKNGEEATLAIDAGKFVGAIADANEPAATTLTGGTYDKDNNDQTTLEGFLPDETYEVVADGELYWKVQVAPIDYVASVTANGTEMGPFETVEEALAAVQTAEQAENYPIIVTALADDGLEITDQNRTAKIAKDVTITIPNAGQWICSGVLNYAGAIDGTVTAEDIEKINGAEITLGLGAFVSVRPTSAIDASFFTSGEEGYEVQLTDTHGSFNSFALVKVWTVTVTLGEGITAVATNATQGGAAKVFEESGTFKVNNNDVIGIEYACAVPGYEPTLEGEIKTITADTEFEAEKQAINYTITYMYESAALTELTPKTYTVEAAATLPTEVELLDGASFEAWYDNAKLEGDPVTEIALGSTGNKTFYAKASKVVDPVAEIIEDKVDGFDQLEKEQQQAAYDNVQALYGQFESVPAAELWIEAVYGSTGAKIPAEKLAASTEELVSISVKYDLPILTTAVEAQVVATTADGFNFKLVDGEDVNVAMAAVEEMIEYSADLSTFAVNKDEVGAEVDEDGVTIKATFLKPADEAKGFMKLHLTADDE